MWVWGETSVSDFGPPASGLALMDPAPDWFVVEVSSFQLADIVDFAPTIGVVTNLAPDHLDRYPSVEAYYADKARLFENATPESTWVLNGDAPEVEALAGDAPGRRFRFSLQDLGGSQAFLRDGTLVLKLQGGRGSPPLRRPGSTHPGPAQHGQRSCSVPDAAMVAGASASVHRQGLEGAFAPSRTASSRSGTPGAFGGSTIRRPPTWPPPCGALGSLEGPLVLLLGGKDKGEGLTPLREATPQGRSGGGHFWAGQGSDGFGSRGFGSPPGCGRLVRGRGGGGPDAGSEEGDILLLSPACSSFDMFENYVGPGEPLHGPGPRGGISGGPAAQRGPGGPGGHPRCGVGQGLGAGGSHGCHPASLRLRPGDPLQRDHLPGLSSR